MKEKNWQKRTTNGLADIPRDIHSLTCQQVVLQMKIKCELSRCEEHYQLLDDIV